MSSIMAGGWTEFRFNISEEERKIFEEATKGLVGVDYSPVAVATQVVAGMNYCFFCSAKIVYPEVSTYAVLMYILAPLEGQPHITEIKKINP